MTALPRKTARVTIGVWYDQQDGEIHLSIPDFGLSTISSDREKKRGHPHLFNKLAKVLREQGKPHPPIVEDWDHGRG